MLHVPEAIRRSEGSAVSSLVLFEVLAGAGERQPGQLAGG